jgi:hypothetical protein
LLRGNLIGCTIQMGGRPRDGKLDCFVKNTYLNCARLYLQVRWFGRSILKSFLFLTSYNPQIVNLVQYAFFQFVINEAVLNYMLARKMSILLRNTYDDII